MSIDKNKIGEYVHYSWLGYKTRSLNRGGKGISNAGPSEAEASFRNIKSFYHDKALTLYNNNTLDADIEYIRESYQSVYDAVTENSNSVEAHFVNDNLKSFEDGIRAAASSAQGGDARSNIQKRDYGKTIYTKPLIKKMDKALLELAKVVDKRSNSTDEEKTKASGIVREIERLFVEVANTVTDAENQVNTIEEAKEIVGAKDGGYKKGVRAVNAGNIEAILNNFNNIIRRMKTGQFLSNVSKKAVNTFETFANETLSYLPEESVNKAIEKALADKIVSGAAKGGQGVVNIPDSAIAVGVNAQTVFSKTNKKPSAKAVTFEEGDVACTTRTATNEINFSISLRQGTQEEETYGVSAKSYLDGQDSQYGISLQDGSSLISYLYETDNYTFINHYLNAITSHGRWRNIEKGETNTIETSSLRFSAHEAMKAIVTFHSLRGFEKTTGNNGGVASDIFVINDRSAPKGQNIKVYSTSMLANRINAANAANITIGSRNGSDLDTLVLKNEFADTVEDRLSRVLAQTHQTKLYVSFNGGAIGL